MQKTVRKDPNEVPLEVEEQIDRICLRFEESRQGEASPGLRQYLSEVPDIWQAALFRELVCIDIDYRIDGGEKPKFSDYAQAYPEFTEVLRDVLADLGGRSPARFAPFRHRNGSSQRTGTLRKVGNYRIIRELGRGGMGVVYKAIQAPLGRHVALKVMAPRHTTETEIMRFRARRRLFLGCTTPTSFRSSRRARMEKSDTSPCSISPAGTFIGLSGKRGESAVDSTSNPSRCRVSRRRAQRRIRRENSLASARQPTTRLPKQRPYSPRPAHRAHST